LAIVILFRIYFGTERSDHVATRIILTYEIPSHSRQMSVSSPFLRNLSVPSRDITLAITIRASTTDGCGRFPHQLGEVPRLFTEARIIIIIVVLLITPCVHGIGHVSISLREVLAIWAALEYVSISKSAPEGIDFTAVLCGSLTRTECCQTQLFA